MKLPAKTAVNLRVACLIIIVIIGCSISYHVGNSRGYKQGRRAGAAAGHEAGFVASFAALERLRTGETDLAIENLEAFCFGTAVALLQQPDLRSNVVGHWFRKDLLQYRRENNLLGTNRYPTEGTLDNMLQAIERR